MGENFDYTTQVTSGFVSVEDGVKKAEEYAPPRKVRVELNFTVGVGESFEGMLDTVSQAASNRVASLLGTTALNVVPDAATPAAGATPAATRVRRTKAQIEADAAAAKAGNAAPDPASIEDPTGGQGPNAPVIQLPDGTGTKDPAAIDDDLTSSGPAAPVADASAITDDDLTSSGPAAVEITDAELNAAVQKKNAEVQDPPSIRSLIGSFNPDPTKVFQLREIPAAQRQDFLNKLAALKAKAA